MFGSLHIGIQNGELQNICMFNHAFDLRQPYHEKYENYMERCHEALLKLRNWIFKKKLKKTPNKIEKVPSLSVCSLTFQAQLALIFLLDKHVKPMAHGNQKKITSRTYFQRSSPLWIAKQTSLKLKNKWTPWTFSLYTNPLWQFRKQRLKCWLET